PEKYENLDFQAKVLERYKSYLPQFAQKGVRIEVVDSSKPIEEVSLEVRNILEKMPIFKG
ncbi:MAG: dTMP kinase, partial [Treponema sp.]|nr:dTMP kinase [Treponema sp.]